MNLAKIIQQGLSKVVCKIDEQLVSMHILKPRIVRYMDGGICSQMHMYAAGHYYSRQGFDVYYDLGWFKYSGKDLDGNAPRVWELQAMFPNLEVKTLSKFQTWFFKKFLLFRPDGSLVPKVDTIRRSMYLTGYLGVEWKEKDNPYNTIYTQSTMNTPKKLAQSACTYCGVHVRRGDLANVNIKGYGTVTDGYFLRAINYVQSRYKDVKFLFFSDDLAWVEENIVPDIQTPYELVKGNKAYEDLGLLAQCPIIVASQGSFGKVAARLNPQATLIMCDNEYAIRTRPNTILIK